MLVSCFFGSNKAWKSTVQILFIFTGHEAGNMPSALSYTAEENPRKKNISPELARTALWEPLASWLKYTNLRAGGCPNIDPPHS